MTKIDNVEYDGDLLDELIQKLPEGATRMSAYLDAMHQADTRGDHKWRLLFRYQYACEATFHDDPPKCMPIAFQFGSIFEEHPDVLPDEAGIEMYLMITQMAIDPVVFLPQIPIAQWEELMEQFLRLIQRYQIGMRTYWWQMCRFYQYINLDKANEYYQQVLKHERDGLSDCEVCEHFYGIVMGMLNGDAAEAEHYTQLLRESHEFCYTAIGNDYLAHLEEALKRGDMKEAAQYADELDEHGICDRNDLSAAGSMLWYLSLTDLDKAIALLEEAMPWSIGMWERKKVYDFYKGVWCFCKMIGAQRQEVHLLLPEEFALYKSDDLYDMEELAHWFYEQAKEIGASFDRRNGSDYFARDIEKAAALLHLSR